jgi:hypothetical protein
MEPLVHYIPLRKDFSNLDEVLERFKDTLCRRELTENAHRDLIASDRFGYQRLVDGFDRVLADAGLQPGGSPVAAVAVRCGLRRTWRQRGAR